MSSDLVSQPSLLILYNEYKTLSTDITMKYNDQNNRDNTGVNHNITPISAQQLWNQFCRFDL